MTKWTPVNNLRNGIDVSVRFSATSHLKGEIEILAWEVIRIPIKQAAMINLNNPMELVLRDIQHD